MMNYYQPNVSPAGYPSQIGSLPAGPVSNVNPQINNYNTQMGQTGFRVVPVASYDEARAVPTSFAGDTLVLTDFAHGMIYTKTLDLSTGSSIFHGYRLISEEPKPENSFDAKSEIDKLRTEVTEIKKEFGIGEAK